MSSVFKRVASRVIAVVLVVALLAGTLVYEQTEIKIKPEASGDSAESYAVRRLMENSPYLSASRWKRMGMYTAALLNGTDNAEECFVASEIALAGGEYEKALELTQSALAKLENGSNEDKAMLTRQCGYLCMLLGRDGEAVRYIMDGMTLQEDPDAYLVLALLKDDSEVQERERYVELYVAKRGNAPLDEAAGDVALLTGNYTLIESVYTRLYKENPTPENLLFRGYGRYGAGDREKAFTDFEAYRTINGPESAADELLALERYRESDYEGALELFEEALLKEHADRRGCLYFIMLCAGKTGNSERAAEAAQQCLTAEAGETGTLKVNLPVDDSTLARSAGKALTEAGEYELALEQFDKYLAEHPDDEDVLRVRISLILYDGRWQEALDAIEALAGTDATVRYMKGICLYELGDNEGAQAEFEAVINADADDVMKEQCRGYLQKININQLEDSE